MSTPQAQQPTPPLEPIGEAVRQGWSLLAMLAILAVILVATLLLVVVLRRTRRSRVVDSRLPPVDPRDPWAESAKRMSDSIVDYDQPGTDEDPPDEY